VRATGKVNICGFPFRVYLVDDESYPGIVGLDGCCLSTDQAIYIRKGLAREYAFSVLVHEVLHALWYHTGISANDGIKGEEAQITTLTPHLIVAYESAKKVRL
jgi:hypothetical protein